MDTDAIPQIVNEYGASEITGDLLFGGSAFVLADDKHSLPTDLTETRYDRAVLAKGSIAMQFAKIFDH